MSNLEDWTKEHHEEALKKEALKNARLNSQKQRNIKDNRIKVRIGAGICATVVFISGIVFLFVIGNETIKNYNNVKEYYELTSEELGYDTKGGIIAHNRNRTSKNDGYWNDYDKSADDIVELLSENPGRAQSLLFTESQKLNDQGIDELTDAISKKTEDGTYLHEIVEDVESKEELFTRLGINNKTGYDAVEEYLETHDYTFGGRK